MRQIFHALRNLMPPLGVRLKAYRRGGDGIKGQYLKHVSTGRRLFLLNPKIRGAALQRGCF
jgi:hypothetical protein